MEGNSREGKMLSDGGWVGWVELGGTDENSGLNIELCTGWVGGNITAGDFGGLELGGLLRGVKGLAALRAVLVVLPLLGGKTALLLGTCSVPLAVSWVLGQAFTGGFLATSFWSAILTETKNCWSETRKVAR